MALEFLEFLRGGGLEGESPLLRVLHLFPSPPTCVERTSQVPIPQLRVSEGSSTSGSGKDAIERHLGVGRSSGSGLLQQIISGAESSRVVAFCDHLVESDGYITLTKFSLKTVSSVLGSIRKGDFVFLINLKNAYFQIPIYSDS